MGLGREFSGKGRGKGLFQYKIIFVNIRKGGIYLGSIESFDNM